MRTPSLRTELLATFGILTAAALILAVASVVLFYGLIETPHGAAYLSVVIAADVAIFVAFGAYQLRRLVLEPLAGAIAAAEAIAAGDLTRRVPVGTTTELAMLSTSVNRMTDRLLEEQAQVVRMEKLASVGRLAAGIAHEIGNPLAAINGYTHIIGSHLPHAPHQETREAIDGIERESSRIDRIVRGLLDYARPRRVTPTPLDVNDVIRGAVALLEAQGVLRGMQMDMTLTESPSPVLFGERHELEQLFVNLLLNAVDAIGERAERRIAIGCRRVTSAELLAPATRRSSDANPVTQGHDRDVPARVRSWFERSARPGVVTRIFVADSGTGVPEEAAERIFDPFYTTKEPGKGTGLGLAIVARVVDNLGGVVWVQPAREGGAAFVMLFP